MHPCSHPWYGLIDCENGMSGESLRAMIVRAGVIRVRWSPVRVASSYEVYRDGRLLASTKGTSWLDTTAGQARRHTYTVRAVDPGGRSL